MGREGFDALVAALRKAERLDDLILATQALINDLDANLTGTVADYWKTASRTTRHLAVA